METQPVVLRSAAVEMPVDSTFLQQQSIYRDARDSSIMVACLAGDYIYTAAITRLPMLVDARTQFTLLSDVILGTSSSLEILQAFSTKLGPRPSLMFSVATEFLFSFSACSWLLLDYPGPIV